MRAWSRRYCRREAWKCASCGRGRILQSEVLGSFSGALGWWELVIATVQPRIAPTPQVLGNVPIMTRDLPSFEILFRLCKSLNHVGSCQRA